MRDTQWCQPWHSLCYVALLSWVSLSHVCQAETLLAHYNMEDSNVWSGVSNELHDVGGYSSGPFHGKAIGSPLPTSAYLNQAKVNYPSSTCAYSEYAEPTTQGGAFLITDLPVDTSQTGQQSISFWMYWEGSPDAFRFGRLFITPAHGSELLALPIQIEAQYWTDQQNVYVRNLADSCTKIPLESIVMKNYHGNLNACETHLSGNANVSQGVSRLLN